MSVLSLNLLKKLRGYFINNWTRRDLNPGPPVPETGALSWLSYGSKFINHESNIT